MWFETQEQPNSMEAIIATQLCEDPAQVYLDENPPPSPPLVEEEEEKPEIVPDVEGVEADGAEDEETDEEVADE